MSKIPPQATRVFKGIIFDVYQWQQEMFDGTKKTFEVLKRPDTVVVIPLQGETVFYAEQEQPNHKPYVSLFGGRADAGEEPLDAAKRELLEETGFVSETWEQIRHVRPGGKVDWNVYYFVARDCKKIADQKLDGGEKITVHSMPLNDFIKTIIPGETFAEPELRDEILSAFNPAKAARLKADILGVKYAGDLTDDEWRNPENKGCCA